jgi:hypothetical protein
MVAKTGHVVDNDSFSHKLPISESITSGQLGNKKITYVVKFFTQERFAFSDEITGTLNIIITIFQSFLGNTVYEIDNTCQADLVHNIHVTHQVADAQTSKTRHIGKSPENDDIRMSSD